MSLVSVLGCGTLFFPIEEQLYYIKVYPLQEILAFEFGMVQSTANEWIHLLSEVLKKALALTDKRIDALENFCALPVQVIFPGVLGENELHSSNSRFVPRPASSSAMDSRRRRAFFGLRRR
jgi:Helix-turn-helix of DDE superfamily endonuclease